MSRKYEMLVNEKLPMVIDSSGPLLGWLGANASAVASSIGNWPLIMESDVESMPRSALYKKECQMDERRCYQWNNWCLIHRPALARTRCPLVSPIVSPNPHLGKKDGSWFRRPLKWSELSNPNWPVVHTISTQSLFWVSRQKLWDQVFCLWRYLACFWPLDFWQTIIQCTRLVKRFIPDFKMFWNICSGVSSLKGGTPVRNSYKIIPKAHQSTGTPKIKSKSLISVES